jgi:hypothetical protein
MKATIAAVALAAFFLIASDGQAQSTGGAKELFGGGSDPGVVGYSVPRRPDQKPQKHPAPSDSEPSAPRAFGLSWWIELIEGSGGPGVQVTDSRVFQSGDRIRLHFQSNAEGHIAIFQFGASGTASKLFPDVSRGLSRNTIHAQTDHVLPSEKHWFRFDATPGTEKLLVLFAKNQADIDAAVPPSQALDAMQTTTLLETAKRVSGSKDLVIETVDNEKTYAVNKVKDLVVLDITLEHQ